jgi:hypothetical protein
MRLPLILICSIAVSSFLEGCSSPGDAVRDSPSANSRSEAESVSGVCAPVTHEKGVIVFRGKYYRTTGPCIQLGNALGMPIIDAFEVVGVLEGDLKARGVLVRAMTEGGPSYPEGMVEGEAHTLRLTPSDGALRQLRENQDREGYTFLWIDGDEIEEQNARE